MSSSRVIWPALVTAALMFSACATFTPAEKPAAAPDQDASAGDDATPAWLVEMMRSWRTPTPPFRIAGNLYYVGTEGLAMYLLPTDEGHILIDGGLPENAPMVAASIKALGYDPADVRILLNTHAHYDHSGGLAELKRLSGARLYASEGDRSALEGGFYLGSEDEHDLDAPPVAVDEIIADGEAITLGGTTLTAHLTPGHSRGCTSWTLTLEEAGTPYDALIFCSASVAANRLLDPPQYEGIVDDYRQTFAKVREWRPDIFLSNHAQFFDMKEKRARQASGDAAAFVDREGFPTYINRMEEDFQVELAKARAQSAAGR